MTPVTFQINISCTTTKDANMYHKTTLLGIGGAHTTREVTVASILKT